jgi:hypothetical protein
LDDFWRKNLKERVEQFGKNIFARQNQHELKGNWRGKKSKNPSSSGSLWF